jgi:hypothetical protein
VDSLTKRLFSRRVDLLGELDKPEVQDKELKALRADTAQRLRDAVAAMSVDNFIVRPKRLLSSTTPSRVPGKA